MTSPSRSTSTGSRATAAGCAPACASSGCRTSSPPSTASGCSSRGPTRDRPGGRWPTPRRPRSKQDVVLARTRPASTCCGSTATSAGPSSTTPPTATGCCCGRTCRCSGATAGRAPAGGPPGGRGGRPARPPSVGRRLVRPQRAAGHGYGAGLPGAGEAGGGGRRRPRPGLARLGWRFSPGRSCRRWNKTVLDRSMRRTLEKADGSRPVVAHSGILPHPAWGTDSHLYLGWYLGSTSATCPRSWPACPSWPASSPSSAPRRCPPPPASASPSAGPTSTGRTWPRAHALQKVPFDRVRAARRLRQLRGVARRHPGATRPSWSASTSRPCAASSTARAGGSAMFCLADAQPAVVVVGARPSTGSPRPAYDALAAACAPVIVVADRPAVSYRPGEDTRPRRPRGQRPADADRRGPWSGAARLAGRRHDLGVRGRDRRRQLRAASAISAWPRPTPRDRRLWSSSSTSESAGGEAHNRYESQIVPP